MRRAAVLACLVAGACAPAAPSRVASAPPSSAPEAAFAPWLQARREEVAATDPRLAVRLRIAPGVVAQRAVFDAILAADEGLRVSGAGIDVFSFDARARALDRVAASVAAPPRFAPGAPGDRLARELFTRAVAEERGRVDEERDLPASASALVRAVVTTWSPPTTPDELRARDRWLAARLDAIRASLSRGSTLRAIEITELEDALDPLERLAEPGAFPGAQAALAELRVALGATHASTGPAMGWAALHARLSLHLGVADDEEPLRRELAATEARLRAESRAMIAALPGGFTSDARLAGAPPLLAPGACDEAASPERVLVCASLRAIAAANDASSLAAAWVSVHDLVAMANWAVAMAADPVDPERATDARPLMGRAPLEVQARLARFAAVRPVACVAVARMAAMLGEGDVGARSSRAKAWLTFGDAPLDVVAREGVAGGR